MFAMAMPFIVKFAWGVAIIDATMTATGMK
jgi:hypothetical protein